MLRYFVVRFVGGDFVFFVLINTRFRIVALQNTRNSAVIPESIEAWCTHDYTIFCTQFETDGWYKRINSDPKNNSSISKVIMDRIFHKAYNILIDGERTCVSATVLLQNVRKRMTITKTTMYAFWSKNLKDSGKAE